MALPPEINAIVRSFVHTHSFMPIFTALHVLHATRSSHEKAVCPYVCVSVRLSVKRVICDKTKVSCAHILIPHERMFILILKTEEWLAGATRST